MGGMEPRDSPIETQIAAAREDDPFIERLARHLEEDRAILDMLADE